MKRMISEYVHRAVLGLAIAALAMLLGRASSGAAQSGAGEQVRVPKKNANVHAGPSTSSVVLVVVPQNTVLTVLERRNVWLQVQLTSQLRQAGTPMRWYKNEDRGWMHESTVEAIRRKTS
jgi:uncharacterized protein YgiM (DUF1202 family)